MLRSLVVLALYILVGRENISKSSCDHDVHSFRTD